MIQPQAHIKKIRHHSTFLQVNKKQTKKKNQHIYLVRSDMQFLRSVVFFMDCLTKDHFPKRNAFTKNQQTIVFSKKKALCKINTKKPTSMQILIFGRLSPKNSTANKKTK